jgi:hypothetical protein
MLFRTRSVADIFSLLKYAINFQISFLSPKEKAHFQERMGLNTQIIYPLGNPATRPSRPDGLRPTLSGDLPFSELPVSHRQFYRHIWPKGLTENTASVWRLINI